MRVKVRREALLQALQRIIGVVERKQTFPVLSNVLLSVSSEGDQIQLVGTDLEVELVSQLQPEGAAEPGKITIPAKKLYDIVRALPEEADLSLTLDGEKIKLQSSNNRFTLSTLPAEEFPVIEEKLGLFEFSLPQEEFLLLLSKTHFAMAQQDVRYFLNGLCLFAQGEEIKAIATDGHRLALFELTSELPNREEGMSVILPRKGVLELMRLLEPVDEKVSVVIGSNHFRVKSPDFIFTCKLIDGKFPDYRSVLPKKGARKLQIDRSHLKEALSRAAILSNEKLKSVRFNFSEQGVAKLFANNPEHEEAEIEIEAKFQGEDIEIGFNISYLQDVLGAMECDTVTLYMGDPSSSALIEGAGEDGTYVVMPMCL